MNNLPPKSPIWGTLEQVWPPIWEVGGVVYWQSWRAATRNPVEALRMFHDNPERFDLVFTDLAMPVISGAELTQKVKLIRPDIPVIVCTGSGQLLTHEKILELGVAKVIYKPLFIKEIAETLRKVLDTDS